MSIKQLSLFENVPPEQDTKAVTTSEEISELEITILLSALTANAIPQTDSTLISALANDPRAIAIARTFDRPKLVRQLRLSQEESKLIKPMFKGNQVFYREREIGRIQLVYKSPSPGELQAKLTHESTIDRFLEFLQKKYQIVSLHESNYHVQIFIPQTQQSNNIEDLWIEFLTKVIFSIYGDFQSQLSGLMQTFITMLKSVTLAGRGFSTLEIPIITRDQAKVLAALYLAIFEQVNDRQEKRETEIIRLIKEIESEEPNSKDLESKEKKLQDKWEMQAKELNEKYKLDFQKKLSKLLEDHQNIYTQIKNLNEQSGKTDLSKAQVSKLQKQKDKIESQIIFHEGSIEEKRRLLEESDGNPFEFLKKQKQTELLKPIQAIAKSFNKTATEQINSTRGDIFTQCILEMYRLLENPKLETIPEPLLTIRPKTLAARTAGDDGKDFCYSCGVTLDAKTARWRVARFMFERPSQRRQSSSSEDRPFICSSCSVLSFASPLKVTDDSIILRLESQDDRGVTKVKIKDYLRMLTNKEVHLSSGCYIALTSEKTITGDTASEKLGQFQYALAKVASILPLEVIKDFKFVLQLQRTEKVLVSRQLIFIKGLIEGYHQSIIVSGKDINLKLGDAIRYVQQDSPYLADYTLLKASSISDRLLLERVREQYLQTIIQDIQGEDMTIDSLWKRAKLYEDVAALTGLTYAFAQSLESTAKKLMKPEDAEREVSKLIEKVDDPFAFSYYATLGDEKKISVQARLYHNPDNYFIYEQAKKMLEDKLEITNREEVDNSGKKWLVFYADDITKSYAYFANPDQEGNYAQEKEWKNLTYNLKLSLYTRFPELVRKLSSKGYK
ncbi:MAG: hypothetical protein EWV49_13720 [Microcystis aeruginosa Ma_QC_Ch_20071001_S25]|jgi:hypothetical protein|uniref:Uncharacterized protein n=1 Tax=Microcystis aeruginosa Ma_QC_Ch_20071001_S25D TaxID=2486250 RepID=A0A552G1K2_MICAE|nr:MAG: hypothetical protein EWV49_13720 [Microcystis aeruginosa Ma_QC_Ch_20071001_S25]TRU52767.1 MAG: hypothetical protein EWV57_04950 [Microcystis aeruginosa Ma_QC_Ch_20071001_S25D]TRU57839.1 MAG: hypothetical protein EWV90_19985 [Microcystis aeruginosa Ma_QC_Ch_20071001_M135]